MARFDPVKMLRPALQSYDGYTPIEAPEEIAARHGVPVDRIVKLDANENPYGPSPKARAALAGEYGAHRYPDPDQRRLREALGAWLGVPAQCVVAGAGSDELIETLFRCCVDASERVLISSPTFGMYAFDAEQHGAQLVDVPRTEGWELDRGPLLEAARSAKAVFLASPNNPTANPASRELIEELLERGALVVVDEAYIEFSQEDSLAPLAASGAPLAVLRTFSKWGGLAGLRVGYGVMPEALAGAAMNVRQPYSLGVAAEVAALASLDDVAVLDERACTVLGERERMEQALRGTEWIEPAPSDTNFLLCRVLKSDGATVRDALQRRGVLVRYFDQASLRQYIRISTGTAEDTDRLIGALDEVAAELAGELGVDA
ncbi:MAG: histidinol-phosphate transaminase [Dehalococcoidia bacterium]|jgi:histidinol-phosphate aminotransferase|nr:histidinol-phosphate transaminase [Dehalococcoidia bacterium]